MSTSSGYLAFVTEQLAGLGAVRARRMFGAAGIYCDGVMFALISDETLYFKVDDANRADFEAEDLEPFTYATSSGHNAIMSYWRVPERLFDDPDEMRAWAGKALGAAMRGRTKAAPPKPRAPRTTRGARPRR